MRQLLRSALNSVQADYIEIRVEETNITKIDFVGNELENIGESVKLGGCVRAYINGGWGFVSFNNLDNLSNYIEIAVREAALVGKGKSSLTKVSPQIATIISNPKKNPCYISLQEKHDLCAKYNQIILNFSPKIQTSKASYRDSILKKYFVSSEGSDIYQERIFAGMTLTAIAKDGNNVQYANKSVGDQRGYITVENLEDEALKVAERAVHLLDVQPVKGGRYTTIIDQELCGVFIHEAFGHLSEADFVYENERMIELMALGKRFGVDKLTIIDDGSLKDEAGSYPYDDEGVASSKTYLIKDGILSSRLHSRETSSKTGERVTGNARAINYNYEPIVRMSNTYLEPRDVSFEEMIKDIKEGIYAKGAIGGNTNCEMFTFSAQEAFLIKDGKIDRQVRDVVLSGNVFETLMNIDAIGNDLVLFGGLGGCGKEGQSPLPVSVGGPHIRIKNLLIGGR